MASDIHKISLFCDEYMEKLSTYTSVQSLVWELTAYATWSDHSVLRVLASSCEEATKLLDDFDSRLDPMQPLISYDLPSYLIPNMVPSENSAYTLFAVRPAQILKQPSLHLVYNTRSVLMKKCAITQHCFQLLAMRHNPTVIYWMIPKSIEKLIDVKILEDEKGIIEVSVYKQSAINNVTENQPLFVIDSIDVKVSSAILHSNTHLISNS